jgi:hypothetical protein
MSITNFQCHFVEEILLMTYSNYIFMVEILHSYQQKTKSGLYYFLYPTLYTTSCSIYYNVAYTIRENFWTL